MTEQAANELVAQIEAHKEAGGVLYVLSENDEGYPRFYAHRNYSAEVEHEGGSFYQVNIKLSLCEPRWKRNRFGYERLWRGAEILHSLNNEGVFFTEAELFQAFRENIAAEIAKLNGWLQHYDDPGSIQWDNKPEDDDED
jgi:hypothetical protein